MERSTLTPGSPSCTCSKHALSAGRTPNVGSTEKSSWPSYNSLEIVSNETRGVPSAKKTVAQSLYYMKPQISLAWINKFLKIWGHMKA